MFYPVRDDPDVFDIYLTELSVCRDCDGARTRARAGARRLQERH